MKIIIETDKACKIVVIRHCADQESPKVESADDVTPKPVKLNKPATYILRVSELDAINKRISQFIKQAEANTIVDLKSST